MRDQLKWLEELQKHDAKIKELTDALGSIPARIKATENDLTRVELLLSQERAQLDETRKYLADQRGLLELEASQVTNAKHKLSQSNNPREANAAQREIDQTREMSQTREGEIKKLVEATAAKEKVLNERAGEVQALRAGVEKDKEQSSSKQTEAQAQLAILEGERTGLSAKLRPDVLKRYAVIRNKKGDAVVAARHGACSACNMKIPPQLYNTIRRGLTIESCPYCHRIIFAEELFSEAASTPGTATA